MFPHGDMYMLRIALVLQLYWDFRQLCTAKQTGIKGRRRQVADNVLTLSCDNLLVWQHQEKHNTPGCVKLYLCLVTLTP